MTAALVHIKAFNSHGQCIDNQSFQAGELLDEIRYLLRRAKRNPAVVRLTLDIALSSPEPVVSSSGVTCSLVSDTGLEVPLVVAPSKRQRTLSSYEQWCEGGPLPKR